MRLRTLIVADLAIFAVAAVVFIVLLPSNIDVGGGDVSPVYTAALYIAIGALAALVVLLVVAAARKFAKPS